MIEKRARASHRNSNCRLVPAFPCTQFGRVSGWKGEPRIAFDLYARQLWVNRCHRDGVGMMAGVPLTAADLLRRPSRQSRLSRRSKDRRLERRGVLASWRRDGRRSSTRCTVRWIQTAPLPPAIR